MYTESELKEKVWAGLPTVGRASPNFYYYQCLNKFSFFFQIRHTLPALWKNRMNACGLFGKTSLRGLLQVFSLRFSSLSFF